MKRHIRVDISIESDDAVRQRTRLMAEIDALLEMAVEDLLCPGEIIKYDIKERVLKG